MFGDFRVRVLGAAAAVAIVATGIVVGGGAVAIVAPAAIVVGGKAAIARWPWS